WQIELFRKFDNSSQPASRDRRQTKVCRTLFVRGSGMRRGGTWIQRWRVPLGFLSAGLFVLLARPRPLTLAIGAGISILGLMFRAWAAGHIRKNDALAVSGP